MKIEPMSVQYVDHMGSDLSVVNAARVSMHKKSTWETQHEGFAGVEKNNVLQEKDVKLINYLAKHSHWTPFAHTSITLLIKAPIFIARQAGKHQVGLVWNEVSRRYVDDTPEFWFPEVLRSRPENVKQGSGGEHPNSAMWLSLMKDMDERRAEVYEDMIADSVAPEQSRMHLPQNMMTEWYWTGSLAAFCRVCKLRLDPHAQQEIQELAEGIQTVVEPLFPVSYKAMIEN